MSDEIKPRSKVLTSLTLIDYFDCTSLNVPCCAVVHIICTLNAICAKRDEHSKSEFWSEVLKIDQDNLPHASDEH